MCLAAGHPWLTVGMGALFSMAFRYTLNDVRDLDWQYVNAASSYYDAVFVGLYWAAVVFWLVLMRKSVTVSTTDQTTNRAGLLAYIVEAVVLALTILLV